MDEQSNLIGNKYNRLTVISKTSQKSGSNYLWECQCECGNITYATKYALITGKKKSCGCLRSALGKSKKKDLLGQRFGSLEVIEETDQRKDGKVVWKCRCDCGNYIFVSSRDLLGDRKSHCGCQTVASRGEEKIMALLNKYNIPYEREKTFSDLIYNGKKLRYDFFVQGSYLIEYDGKQHFIKDSGYGSDLENIQKRDKIKTVYAQEHHIPLIRINYLAYDKFTINDLLLNPEMGERSL